MNLTRYKISNLLYYQIADIKKILDEEAITVVQNVNSPHFSDIYVGLNPTEVAILCELGYCLNKHIGIGESSIVESNATLLT